MGIERTIGWAAIGIALILGAGNAIAAPPEPVILTPLPDPDAGFVPWHEQSDRVPVGTGEDPTLDKALANVGRVIAAAMLVDQRAVEATCKSAAPSGGASRMAWEANCRYIRR